MITDKEYREVLKDTFDFTDFKSEDQEKACKLVMSGEKNIVISMATQAGKTLCYQLPSSFQRDGIILVITPSISLIMNQTAKLNELRIPCIGITSVLPRSKRDEIIEHLEDYEVTPLRFIYMTPEMLIKGGYDTREIIDTLMNNGQISHVAVDEAHCIIDKSYRESFHYLKNVRNKYPNIPWIATTTGTNVALRKIADELSMHDAKIFKSTSDRKKIFYDVIRSNNEVQPNFKEIIADFLDLDEKEEEMDNEKYINSKTKRIYASGIIFCASNRHADIIADGLCKQGVTAKSYYGAKQDVNLIQKQWKDGLFPVLVATTESFGLGICRKPLKFIVHFTFSKGLRSYYQESGRVDAEKSFARIYINKNFISNPYFIPPWVYDYINTKKCRHQHIATFFGDEVEKCGVMCDNCLGNVKKN